MTVSLPCHWIGSPVKKHDAVAPVGCDEEDPCCFQCATDLIRSALMNGQTALGLKPLEGSQRYKGVRGKLFLRPVQQGPCRPDLSASDHP
ncbi:hypothetical protein KUA08_05005 [Komagataeibacter melomenusus]|nr:hypothetical protein [Komagataeibacter melomenusus]